MFGFVIGFASLVGLISVLRRGRHARFGHGGCGHHRHGHDGHHHRRGFRRRGPFGMLDGLFAHLDTSPGQEKAIRAALAELFDEAHELRGEVRETGEAARSAVAGPAFDESALDAAFERHDAKLARLRVGAKEALRRIHEALDDEQRVELGRMLARRGFGGVGRFGFGPYR
ncbi:MAG: periplasmic heavy metal sensor [Sandaracinus sp.]|nr:periplasmic heavy metal sensor [Sandaracinus sp.]